MRPPLNHVGQEFGRVVRVRRLVQHATFVEHRYSAIIPGRPVPSPQATDHDDLDAEAMDGGLDRLTVRPHTTRGKTALAVFPLVACSYSVRRRRSTATARCAADPPTRR
jgi:hypothetical protein